MNKAQSYSELAMIFIAALALMFVATATFKHFHPEAFASTTRVLSAESTNLSWDLDSAASSVSHSLNGDFSVAGTRERMRRSISDEEQRLRRDNVNFGAMRRSDLLDETNKTLGLARR